MSKDKTYSCIRCGTSDLLFNEQTVLTVNLAERNWPKPGANGKVEKLIPPIELSYRNYKSPKTTRYRLCLECNKHFRELLDEFLEREL